MSLFSLLYSQMWGSHWTRPTPSRTDHSVRLLVRLISKQQTSQLCSGCHRFRRVAMSLPCKCTLTYYRGSVVWYDTSTEPSWQIQITSQPFTCKLLSFQVHYYSTYEKQNVQRRCCCEPQVFTSLNVTWHGKSQKTLTSNEAKTKIVWVNNAQRLRSHVFRSLKMSAVDERKVV